MSDQADRQRLKTELDRTFFVEAGAGTGKTRELVGRVVELVAAGRVRMEKLAAITFTEAAAAELRGRVRQGLEQAASEAGRSQAARSRCDEAAREVDLASIQTIHAFAGTVLRTFPLEAGLPPGFTIWDQVQRDRHFEERFRAWFYDEVTQPELRARRETVRSALALGLTPDRLRGLAKELEDHCDLLEITSSWAFDPLPDLLDIAHRHGAELVKLQELLHQAHNGEEDPLVQEVRGVHFTALRMQSAKDQAEALAALLGFEARPPKSKGSMAAWDTVGNPVTSIKSVFSASREEVCKALETCRSTALADLLVHLRDFTRAYSNERRELGVATFHDLLARARDLLRDNPDVRMAAVARFDRLLVDEFQDTDPLQAEIAWLLAADPGQAEERDWRKLKLVPGKLFLVGDPKQSIYRFRRADIGMYDQIYACLDEPDGLVQLKQSFRSVEPLVRWVNQHFTRTMQLRPGVQARYVDLEPRPNSGGLALEEGVCGVRYVGGLVEGRAYNRWRDEAEAMARLAHSIVAERWPVTILDAQEPRQDSACFSDICVLLPTRTNLRNLERAFEKYGVPYRIESGSLVLNTQEVRDLLSCLRAIDDPSDQVALVAALRSPAYSCSDTDLLAWVEAGGRLSFEREGSGCDGSVRQAFTSLRGFHAARTERSAAATIEAFLRERMLAVQAFGQRRPREAWRRLRYVVTQARQLADSGEPSLRALLDWLEGLQRSLYYDAESPVSDSDENAVRFMTVHGSKGLEFPVVLLTGLGAAPRGYRGEPLVAPIGGTGQMEVRCGSLFQTRDYDKDREDELNKAEEIRLLYVAATRAREHLVLSLFHSQRDDSQAKRLFQDISGSTEELCREVEVRSVTTPGRAVKLPAAQPTPEEHAREELLWGQERQRLISEGTELPVHTPSGLAARSSAGAQASGQPEATAAQPTVPIDPLAAEDPRLAGAERSEGPPLRRAGRGATRLGRAVHAVLQSVDLATLASLETLAEQVSFEHELRGRAAEIVRLAEAAISSVPVQNAIAAGRYWREMPVGIELDGSLLEGSIDLLYEHPDGSLGVVDYKTDRVPTESVDERAARYRVQGGAYALAVEKVTGRQVSSIEFVFAALGGRTVTYAGSEVTEIIAEARALLTSAEIPPIFSTS